ncbi:MAG TPA: hypothetical protein PKD54_11340 [Pirellulaceae bacterium]|nr:hypothetical protein [Pirellulaceae bacterium]
MSGQEFLSDPVLKGPTAQRNRIGRRFSPFREAYRLSSQVRLAIRLFVLKLRAAAS